MALHDRAHGRRVRDARHLGRTTGRSATSATRVACEDQFRNAFLLGCVGAWSLHPSQIEIANRVFSPSVEDIKHARRVVAALQRDGGDGTGAVMLDGKMEDDASLKQCLVLVELAEQLAAVDPKLKEQYDAIEPQDDRVMSDFRPRRSVLYMPASNERALEKAKSIPCDGLILDLEDAVAPDAKTAAREAACAAAASGDYGRRELTIRVNGADTEWHADDLAAACAAGPDGIVVPKVSSADEVHALVEAMQRHGAPDHTSLWAMVETPRAMLHAEEIAAASDRLTVLVMGTNDLAKELYAEHVPGRAPLLTGLSLALLAARATGTAILDGVFNDVQDADGFLAECRQGREMGFDGKTLIHPGQVEGANADLRPQRAGRRGRPRHRAGLGGRAGQWAGLRRGHLPRPDGRVPPRRHRPPHPGHPRRVELALMAR